MTNFLIFFIVILVLALIIFWMILDYQFTRYIREMKAFYKEEDLQNKSQPKLSQQIHHGSHKCSYTQS
ncbi:hypothetical protein MWMV1_MWMV1_02423 [Acinetobacter baumannii]|nr:hypothetical protein MWMV6_MWMV6_02423 [Acinetobacter baumannii]CAI4176745.1 hypothetical protein MWMV1_MWMV1_02423 [Acinetobacter baumannii]